MASSGLKCGIIVLFDRGHPFRTPQLLLSCLLPRGDVGDFYKHSCVQPSPGEFDEGDAMNCPNRHTVGSLTCCRTHKPPHLNPPLFDALSWGSYFLASCSCDKKYKSRKVVFIVQDS